MRMPLTSKEWFSEWFNSPYYHILYKHRDFEEAKAFIDALSGLLRFERNQKALDAGCGRGRHAIYLNEKGLDVTGIDISEESIAYANRFQNEKLKFLVHDMREPVLTGAFDLIFNLFTSFGYFENEEDNFKTIHAFAESMKSQGRLVIDFMNTEKILCCLVPSEETEVKGIKFYITRKAEKNFIVKTIRFSHGSKDYEFCEKVRIIYQDDFLKYFNFAGLKLTHLLGDYKLNEYHPQDSDRMVFVVTKN